MSKPSRRIPESGSVASFNEQDWSSESLLIQLEDGTLQLRYGVRISRQIFSKILKRKAGKPKIPNLARITFSFEKEFCCTILSYSFPWKIVNRPSI